MAETRRCQHAKSDITPCYYADGALAIFEKAQPLVAYCVGCERRVYPTNAEWSRYAKLRADVEAAKRRPHKKRR
jgi:hypothetical protein